ncbi:MAG: transaldolase [Thermomicrobiales bacterium]|nr:transaldolase [Thermomicrobiales bacterium]
MNARVAALLEQGQSIWQDDIARSMLTSGSLQSMIDDVGIRGVTSNPSIFEKAIAAGSDYDEQISRLARDGADAATIFEKLAVADIRGACDLFRPIYDASDGADGFVSIEVNPDLARDSDGTRTQVRQLWEAVNRPNLMVKIPGTIEGAPVIGEMLAEGININVTLLFSIEAYERVANAYIEALERRNNASGQPIDRVASVASFFVSRVDTAVDKLLDDKIAAESDASRKGALEALKGKAAVANAKLAYASFKELFNSERFDKLKAQGARPQRPLWASTGTKNPAYSDVLYVTTLIGPHTVNTMPGKTIQAFLDHGDVRRTVDEDIDSARAVMQGLADAGIDFDAVTDKLENDGIDLFITSYNNLLAGVEEKRAALVAAAV